MDAFSTDTQFFLFGRPGRHGGERSHRRRHDMTAEGPGDERGPGERGGRHGHGHDADERGPREGRGPGRGGRGPGRFGPGGPGRGGPGRFGPGGRGGEPELPGFLPGGARVGRGDIRAGILVLLLEGPMHGYQVIHELRERSGGVWRPSPGSVYPTLKRLSAEGLVTSEEGEGRGHRRAFTLTDEGREAADALAAEAMPWDALVADEDRDALELRELVVSVVEAARQVVRVAEPAQAGEAKEVLTEARRRLYAILAADPAVASAGASDAGVASDAGTPDGGGSDAAAADTGASDASAEAAPADGPASDATA